MEIKLLQILGFFFGGAFVAYIINVLLLSFSKSLGIRNKNDITVRWSQESKPSLGGISFFIVFVFSAISYMILFSNAPNVFQNKQFVGLFVAGSLAFLMGLADDAYNTRPLIKLIVQIVCGGLFVLTDTTIDFFHIWYLDDVFTIFWVILIMNSLNMLDNMDGITGTTVFFILITCLLSSWIILEFNANIWVLTLVAVIGAVLGFLKMNIHPSRLFMGDAGSQFIGLFVAFFGIKYLWNIGVSNPIIEHPSWLGLAVVFVAFTPAAVDSLTVVVNRLRKGQSPMVGGKDHTTHHLVYAGLSDFKVWLVFLLIGFLSSVFALAMVNLITLETYYPVPFFIIYTIFVFILLYKNTIKYKVPKKD